MDNYQTRMLGCISLYEGVRYKYKTLKKRHGALSNLDVKIAVRDSPVSW